jgi:RNA-directed DNA polymerase
MVTLFDLLAQWAPFEPKELKALVSTASLRYKVYKIPKRDGRSLRTIAQPAPEVKLLQRILIENIVRKWPVHSAAVAYRPGKSIASHVVDHVDSKFLLKLDFTDFFPSIKAADVRRHAERHTKFQGTDLDMMVNLLCWRNKSTREFALSIGAPSSPIVSNSVMFDFDDGISAFCRARGVAYTRYADDLAFSTNGPNLLAETEAAVETLLGELIYPRLALNAKKTVNVSKRYRRTLVGLIITPDRKISLGRNRKRSIHAALHRYSRHLLAPTAVSGLRGTLAFAWSVEPTFVRSLALKYGDETMQMLGLPFISEQPGIRQPTK